MGLLLFVGLPVGLLLAIFFFMKSSKEMPKNWSQFVCEVRMQICGFQGLLDDFIMRPRNKVARREDNLMNNREPERKFTININYHRAPRAR
uniref:Uncharacterized protein n=1 Tax=Anopheles epiroticus TaxID=199890 RepID=A0A182P526_9DIPT